MSEREHIQAGVIRYTTSLCLGGMYSRVPGKLVNVSGLDSGSRSMIRELPKSAILALNSESSSTFFAVKSRWMMAGVWL